MRAQDVVDVVLETTEADYPAGLFTEASLTTEHRLRWIRTPSGDRQALAARKRDLQRGLDLVPEGWTVRRHYPGTWDTVTIYRVHAPDGIIRAAAAVTARPAPNGGHTLGVKPMEHHRSVLQGPAAMAAAAALALAAAHV